MTSQEIYCKRYEPLCHEFLDEYDDMTQPFEVDLSSNHKPKLFIECSKPWKTQAFPMINYTAVALQYLSHSSYTAIPSQLMQSLVDSFPYNLSESPITS